MPRLVSLLHWKVSVSAALKSFVSCPKRICAWWADVADIASSMTFSDGNVSAVSRPLNTFRWNPLVTAEGAEGSLTLSHSLSLTHTHVHAVKRKTILQLWHAVACSTHTSPGFTFPLLISLNCTPTLPVTPIFFQECWCKSAFICVVGFFSFFFFFLRHQG